MNMSFIEPDFYNGHKLTDEQVKKWKSKGYLLLDGMFSFEILYEIKNVLDKVFPNKKVNSDFKQEFGSEGGKLEFPCEYDVLNQITLDKNIITCVKQLLGDDDIRLIQSDAWSKYGIDNKEPVNNNTDQRMHADYPNNYLVHPSSFSDPDSVACIIYYDKYSEVGGSTAIVPRNGIDDIAYQYPMINMPGVAEFPWFNNKLITEDYFKKNHLDIHKFRDNLYKRELIPNFNMGSILFYRHDIWHRGTPVKIGQVRRVQNLGYKKSKADWITTWNPGWARQLAHKGWLEKFILKISVEQRNLLGFPKPGHKYWNNNTIKYVKARYGKDFDITPYIPNGKL